MLDSRTLITLSLIVSFALACGTGGESRGGGGGAGGEASGGAGGGGGDEGGGGPCTSPGPVTGSCRHDVPPTCVDFTGSLSAEEQQAHCDTKPQGSHSSTPCDRDEAWGVCFMGCGEPDEQVLHWLPGTIGNLRSICERNGGIFLEDESL